MAHSDGSNPYTSAQSILNVPSAVCAFSGLVDTHQSPCYATGSNTTYIAYLSVVTRAAKTRHRMYGSKECLDA